MNTQDTLGFLVNIRRIPNQEYKIQYIIFTMLSLYYSKNGMDIKSEA